MTPNHAERYAKSMKSLDFGTMLYHPESSKILRPGSCGYFNGLGRWTPVAFTDRQEDLDKHGLTRPEKLVPRPTSTETWGLQTSGYVRLNKCGAGTEAPLSASLPATVKALITFESSREFGSMLYCPKPIMVHGYNDKSVFKRWVKKNADKILALWPDVKEYGIWIVTDTYSTAEVWIATSSHARQQVSLALSGGVEGGNVRAWGDFIADASTGEWHGSCAEKDEELVASIGGVHISYHHIVWHWRDDLKLNSQPRNILAEGTREDRTGADLDEKHIVTDHQGGLYEVRVEFVSPHGKQDREVAS